MDRQEQTQRSHILEVSGTARPRDIQVSSKPTLICLDFLSETRWVSDSGQKGAVVTLVELEEEGETNSWRGVSQEVMFLKILETSMLNLNSMLKHFADSIDTR